MVLNTISYGSQIEQRLRPAAHCGRIGDSLSSASLDKAEVLRVMAGAAGQTGM